MTQSSQAAARALLLSAYVVPGGPTDPTPVVAQAQAADELGLGSVFIGERYSTKDLGALAGAVSQVTERCRIIAGITHIGTRHPMVLASLGQTLQALSGERFVLGLGRGSPGRWRSYGIAVPTNQMLTDTAYMLRRLWAGERVSYRGPAGSFPDLKVLERPDTAPPPLLLAGVGPRTLEVGGRAFDGVILHPLLTPQGVARAVARIRAAATDVGRDPDGIEIHATVIVADNDLAGNLIGARGLGYLLVAGLGDALVAANEWDPEELARIRGHNRFAGLDYNALKSISREELAGISRELPSHWFTTGAAVGTTSDCADRLDDYLSAGATGILVHGSTPDTLGPLVDAFTSNQ